MTLTIATKPITARRRLVMGAGAELETAGAAEDRAPEDGSLRRATASLFPGVAIVKELLTCSAEMLSEGTADTVVGMCRSNRKFGHERGGSEWESVLDGGNPTPNSQYRTQLAKRICFDTLKKLREALNTRPPSAEDARR
jgi:hypothetical protein